MASTQRNVKENSHRIVKLSRLEALGDAIFAFALTLLALEIRLPDIAQNQLIQAIIELLPKLLVFIFAFLVIAQEWDVHQRTMMHIDHADGIFVWLYLLSLMFVVLMPASADILGRFPLQPISLVFFGINTALLCLSSWAMWEYASRNQRLVEAGIDPKIVRMISFLWLYPPITIIISLPLTIFSVYPVYIIWFLLPIISYVYSVWLTRRILKKPNG